MLYNKFVDDYAVAHTGSSYDVETAFSYAKEETLRNYHSVIKYDFLPQVIDNNGAIFSSLIRSLSSF